MRIHENKTDLLQLLKNLCAPFEAFTEGAVLLSLPE
jgi:hypothetical protein